MEFACGFVYVPPLTNQQSKPNHNAFKRSALLPPLKISRPRTPPPPPPACSAKPPVASPEKRILGQMAVSEDAKNIVNNLPAYENSAFLLKAESANPAPEGPCRPVAPSAVVRKALLPPPMRAQLDNNCLPVPASQPLKDLNFDSQEQELTYDLPKQLTYTLPEIEKHPSDPEYSYNIPEGSGVGLRHLINVANSKLHVKSAPPLPPRPSFMKRIPDYVVLLPKSTTSSTPIAPQVDSHAPASTNPAFLDNEPLPGNPNVILVSLGTLVTEENVQTMEGVPISCSQCGSALDSCYDNMVSKCYFCQLWGPAASQPNSPPMGCQDCLFLLNPDELAKLPAEPLLIFCIDISGSMCITSQVTEGGETIYRSRLQSVQRALVQCICSLSGRKPLTRVGLITFNNQVALHGYGEVPTRVFQDAELIDSDYLKEAALSFPSPLPLSESREHLERQIERLEESGATALGPAALIAITMASQEPGSKVVIFTDGKANTELGNLDDDDTHSLISSTIFYQDLGEYAANQGVLVSVLAIEGTDCRLDELGILADRTGGEAVVASPNNLHTELQQVLDCWVVATHCDVTLLLPTTLTVKGERQEGHKGIREVGNVTAGKEITFRFQAREQDTQILLSGGCVSVQLQIRYRRMDGQRVLRVLSVDRRVTDDSSQVLLSLSLSILQLNSSQSCAALAVRGRHKDAQTEGKTQKKLMERALIHIKSSEEKQQHAQWVKNMDHIYNNIHNYKRSNYGSIAGIQSLTDTGAALLYGMKNGNRKSISKSRTKPNL
ncbi:circularly permutated Ras protein 1-like [Conger conger]|uniref:circularly permutated Ras protein 1-like n=1 Tax=Conger conger TaxID=82655 RepID=UPI002A5A8627|nr:circularly permutated Ras protein 1-like [Conger conger]XP_061086734.1 circularly permutated Ras protein 1-like [Conger conger]